MFTATLSVIVKHRTDLDIVSERVGLKLPRAEALAGAGEGDVRSPDA